LSILRSIEYTGRTHGTSLLFIRNSKPNARVQRRGLEKSDMPEPSEDQLLMKAKELCQLEGKAWSIADLADGAAIETNPGVVADDSDRAEYLNRARILWEQDSR
jgi:hypothetical protein